MRFYLKTSAILLVTVLAITGCKDNSDDTSASSESAITASGTLKGTIQSEILTSTDSIYCVGSELYGKSAVKANGDFSCTLSAPSSSSLYQIGSIEGVTVSDTTALTTNFSVYYVSDESVYMAFRCNSDSIDQTTVGFAMSFFIYSNKAVTITGTMTEDESFSVKYSLSLKTGWNEVYVKILSYNYDQETGVSEFSIEYTSTIPDNMRWLYLNQLLAAPQKINSLMKPTKALFH